MTRKRLLKEMDADELTDWIVYYQLKDEEYNASIVNKIAQEASDETKQDHMRSMFKRLTNGK